MDRWWVMPLAVFAAAGVLGGSVYAGQQLLPGPEVFTPEEDAGDGTAAPEGAVLDLVEFRDEDAGISMELPADWEQLSPGDPAVRLIATPNFRDSVLLRVTPMDLVDESFAELQTLTDDIVATAPDVEVLSGAQELVVDGHPGYHYLYTFFDEGEGERGVHSHYFLFREDALVAVVFQALPEARFSELAPTFDAMAESLRLTDRPS